MRRFRFVYVYALVVVGLLGTGVWFGLRDVGDDSPAQAIYALAHAIEHENAEGACGRLLDAEDVPQAMRAALAIEPAPGATPPCEQRFSSSPDYRAFGFEDALVDKLRRVDVPAQDGITGAAVADVRLEGRRRERVAIVRHRGRWKVVR